MLAIMSSTNNVVVYIEVYPWVMCIAINQFPPLPLISGQILFVHISANTTTNPVRPNRW